MPMFFLYKTGIYGHGVFWIGADREEGMCEADKAANLDKDDYHSWNLHEFVQPVDYKIDGVSRVVYTGKRPL